MSLSPFRVALRDNGEVRRLCDRKYRVLWRIVSCQSMEIILAVVVTVVVIVVAKCSSDIPNSCLLMDMV